MELYIIVIIIVVMLYPITKKKKITLSNNKRMDLRNIYIFIISSILIMMLGFRDVSVGRDTYFYSQIFNNIKGQNLHQVLNVEIERGFRLFQYMTAMIFKEFQFVQIIVAILYISVVSFFIKKHSYNPLISYLLFITYGFFSFAMSTTRQTIAIAFTMIAYHYVIERKPLRFLLVVFLASSFHITALIFLPCYWLGRFRFNKKTILLFLSIGVLIISFRSELINVLNAYSRIEYTSIETGGNRLYILILVSILIGIIYRKPLLNRDESNKYFFYMMITTAIIMPITQFHPAVLRLNLYFFIFMIIYIPNLLYAINNKMIRFIGISGYIIVGVIVFFTQTIYETNLIEYSFFWQ